MTRRSIVLAAVFVFASAAQGGQGPQGSVERRVEELIAVIRRSQLFEHADEWVAAVRELIEIGKPAVPQLAVEIARTEPNLSHRAVAIALRNIGDRRAVPALIHALPKVGIRASDCGAATKDPTLHLFMEEHDNSDSYSPDSSGTFSVGRPVREIVRALESLTQHREGRAIFSSFDEQGKWPSGEWPEDRSRGMFLEVTDRWAAWWQEHGEKLLTAEEQNWVRDQWPARLAAALPKSELQPIDLLILDEQTNQPLPEVKLRLWAYDVSARAATDQQGSARLELPSGGKQTMIVARKEGYVPMRLTWNKDEAVPRQYTLAMSRGSQVGGVVRDEAGQPIRGAAVCFYAPRILDANRWVHIMDFKTTTDAGGRWTFNGLPADMAKITFGVEHDDFLLLSRDFFKPYAYIQHSVEPLKDGTFETVLKRGLTAEGVVTDSSGKPVASAAVRAVGKDSFYDRYGEVRTDERGRFRYANVTAGELTVAVQAEGLAPLLTQLTFDERTNPLELKLQPGRTIEGRVLGADDSPIAGAVVAVGTWEKRRIVKFTTRTDEQGRFVWTGAPSGPVELRIAAEGHRMARVVSAPNEPLAPVRLARQLIVSGRVVDAATGKPIERFVLVPGLVNDGRTYWDREAALEQSGGAYTLNLAATVQRSESGRTENPRALRVEAEGYLPAISRTLDPAVAAGTIDFALEPGPALTGIVVDASGEGIVDATVIRATPSQQAYLHEGRQSEHFVKRQVFARTDAAGRFSLPAEVEPYTLVAVHDRGHARVTQAEFAAAQELRLQPWGRVEGLMPEAASRPRSRRVTLWNPHRSDGPSAPQLHYMNNANVDKEGRFVFERVVPGEHRVGSQIEHGSFFTSSPGVPVRVKPGETIAVTLGGKGRRDLTGRLQLPRDVAIDVDWSAAKLTISPYSPEDDDKAPPAALPANEQITVQPDGQFTVRGVGAGAFTLNVKAKLPPQEDGGQSRSRAGEASASFEVPGGDDQAPLELGDLAVSVRITLDIGELAPLFEAPTLEGDTIRLADFRGKFVLLDFWATWCGPCVAETPNLKAVFEAFGSDSRFAMLALSLDSATAEPAAYSKKHDLKWHQAFLGEWSAAKLPASYGVQGIPQIMLIDPSGKVLAKDLRGAEIKRAVEAALK